MIKIAVIGGGAAGMMAASQLCMLRDSYGAAGAPFLVTLFEKNARLGRKLGITGKGRCNLTNECAVSEFMKNVPTNPKFLYSALSEFDSYDTMSFFEGLGVKLKTERGNRVFPESDRAADIVNALRRSLRCEIINKKVDRIIAENGAVCGVVAEGERYPFDRVILATGGMSYPLTGSTGDGHRMAALLGHTVTGISPSLVPLEISEKWCRELQGLSLRNIKISVFDVASEKVVYSDFGEMMFTHFGVTGPVILSASAMLPDMHRGKYRLKIDLKPALDEKTLDNRLVSDFAKYSNKNFENALSDLLPQKLIPVIVRLSGISPVKKVNVITKDERAALLKLLKSLELTISGFRPIDEAIVTKGGISVSEINPKTMESKKVKGLYFAGEIIDVDAYTGGFNLQIAFSTAVVAARSVIEE